MVHSVAVMGFSKSWRCVGLSRGGQEAGMSILSSLLCLLLVVLTKFNICHVLRLDSCIWIFLRYFAFVCLPLFVARCICDVSSCSRVSRLCLMVFRSSVLSVEYCFEASVFVCVKLMSSFKLLARVCNVVVCSLFCFKAFQFALARDVAVRIFDSLFEKYSGRLRVHFFSPELLPCPIILSRVSMS